MSNYVSYYGCNVLRCNLFFVFFCIFSSSFSPPPPTLPPLPKLLRGKEWIWGNTAMWERKKIKKKKIIRIIIVIIIPGMFCIFFSLSCRGFREEDGVVGGREGGVWRTEIKTGLVGRQRRVEDGRMYVQAFKVPVGLIAVKRNQDDESSPRQRTRSAAPTSYPSCHPETLSVFLANPPDLYFTILCVILLFKLSTSSSFSWS